jgi:hypothetical protein
MPSDCHGNAEMRNMMFRDPLPEPINTLRNTGTRMAVDKGIDVAGTLKADRAAMIEEIALLRTALEKTIAKVGALDEVISIYDRKHVPWAANEAEPVHQPRQAALPAPKSPVIGHVTEFFAGVDRQTLVADAMKSLGKPSITKEIVDRLCESRNAVLGDGVRTKLLNSVSATLDKMVKRGRVVTGETERNKPNIWALVG